MRLLRSSQMQLIYMKVQVQRPTGTAALSAGVLTTTSVIGCDREHCGPGGLNFDGEQVRDESDSTSVEWDAEETWSKNFSLFTTDPDPITYNQYNVRSKWGVRQFRVKATRF